MSQILEAPAGYKVRATVRKHKLEIRNAYAAYVAEGRLEVVELTDLVHEHFPPSWFEGVDAVMHVASPLAGRETPEKMLETAVEGTLNIVRQAEAAGIRKFVVTSSIASLGNPTEPALSAKSWNPITREIALKSNNAMIVYLASKTLAERALWEFADSHPHLDVATINPVFLYGPFSKTQEAPADSTAMATNAFFYHMLYLTGGVPSAAAHVDVRDAARAHVLALKTLPTEPGSIRKRFPISSPNPLRWRDVVQLIRNQRPGLAERLTKVDVSAADSGPARLIVEFDRLESILGFRQNEFRSLEDTVLAAVDGVVEAEKRWNSRL
ncbi:hypothetical protein HGRIS_002763 [Hohenbuehelia grisea]|uniref:NAD-dependent epimerase/dehydratase domain-containing protein n=1 Tax=Hohenbuehelia grisea TaxID=104357 RepID=A0ABR3JLF4_9AGAR